MTETKKKRGSFRRLLDRLVGLRGKKGTERMVEEFAERFPGRCMICAYHQYGLREGFTSEPEPAPHDCIEKQPNLDLDTTLGA